jgi:hypothetical protein
MTNETQNPLENLVKAMRADPKKAAALAVLAACLGVMVVRTVMPGGGGPSGARAASGTAAASGVGGASGSGNSGQGAAGFLNPWRTGSGGSANQPLSLSAAIQKWSDAPVPPVSRNLFAVRIDYFPVDGSRTTQFNATDEGFWGKLEKSLALQADQRDKRENLIANFKAQAAKLRLESTMMGPQPKALVNGEFVGEGSVVASFRVLKIEARRMIVEREGIRLEIVMK